MFISGELTHSVLKRAADGEFRVEAKYGGRTTVTTPPAEVQAAATRAVQFPGPNHVYARVVPALGALIMEVEMAEPDLFLGLSGHAAERLADAVLSRI